MSLIFRAIWNDSVGDPLEFGLRQMQQWVAGKYPGLDTVSESASLAEGEKQVSYQSRIVDATNTRAYEGTLVEDDGQERWMTRLRVLHDEQETTFWVDLERVSTNAFDRPPVVAPKLVRNLIDAGGKPRVGKGPISTTAFEFNETHVREILVPLVRDKTRTLPIVLFSHDSSETRETTMRRADDAAKILAGTARVFAINAAGHDQFVNSLGQELAVYEGAARLFLPGSLDGWRHRYLPREDVRRHPRAAGERFARMLSSSMASQRAPVAYERVRRELRSAGSASDAELLQLALDELETAENELAETRAKHEALELEYLGVLDELDSLGTELAGKTAALRSMYTADDAEVAAGFDLPVEVFSFRELVEASSQLEHVEIPDAAWVDLDDLDAAPEARSWANNAWRGLRALNAYASRGDSSSGFWAWCEQGTQVDSWPASEKKLAMSESETVTNRPELRRHRVLPVSPKVSDSGKSLMVSHLKIASGGPLSPRIYFLDDVKSTGKIHVGFIGPHKHMPNAHTN